MTIRGFAFIKGAAGENSVALWGPIKLGQKVVCFMGPAHKARTKSGLLYGQQISANQGKNPPPILLDLVLNKGGLSIRDAQIFACGARFTLRNPTLGA